jgi:hypothetical protein
VAVLRFELHAQKFVFLLRVPIDLFQLLFPAARVDPLQKGFVFGADGA